jgi:hypothetical protein
VTKRITLIANSTLNPVTTSGNSREFPELSGCKRLLIFVTVTATSGSSQTLNVNLEYRDPATSQATAQYVRVQTRIVGINAAGVYTTGGYSLGTVDQVTSTTPLPWTECRALTDTELLANIVRVSWVLAGSTPSFTFSVSLIGETEE